jgi:hypothetical protein
MKMKTGGMTKKQPHEIDLKELYEQYLEKYGQVFMHDFGEAGVFIFKSLGRKDFRELRDTEAINDYAKEEIICEQCVLYPKDFDYENCEEAGLPTQLANLILEKSLLKSSEQLATAVHYFRDRLWDTTDEQLTCIIHEAFPEYSIEEIANWDVMRTAEYMAKAEYILHKLRGIPLTDSQGNEVEYIPASARQAQEAIPAPPQNAPMQTMEERFVKVDSVTPATSKPNRNDILKPKKAMQQPVHNDGKVLHKDDVLTPQKLMELQRLYPDIDWARDSVSMKGISALKNQSFDDRPIAEIPTDDSEEGMNAIPEALRSRFKVIKQED